MRRHLLVSSLFLAACGGSPAHLANRSPGGPDPDLGILFAPQSNHGVLAKHLVAAESDPDEKREDGEPAEPGDDKRRAYDLDGDGVVDLKLVSRVMYGPSQGWEVSIRRGKEYAQVFATSGGWGDERDDGSHVLLRYATSILAPGEAEFSTLLRYDRATKSWGAPVKAYMAQQTKAPAIKAPYAPFTTAVVAELRATPEVDDAPAKNPDDLEDGGFSTTATLRGNLLATYNAGARGLVLAAQGEWRYVAFDPATPPKESSLAHGMNHVEEGHPSDAWQVGWVKASEVGAR
ncbi:MAG: hypothetical protein KF773_02315 [Deltaproteobacteria bacterium]|nr:hypothetical protein [Deltaproteobacteria bacterium]